MIYQFMNSGLSPEDSIIFFLIAIFVFFISVMMHELAHGFVAYKMGDLTAKMQGRLTLNPFNHLDLTGFICFLFLGIGWAKPIPVNPLNFKKFKTGNRLVSIAGIVTNFTIGLIAAVVLGILYACGVAPIGVMYWVYISLNYFMIVNGMLALFNLIPLFPLDGFQFVATFLKPNNKFVEWNHKHGIQALFGVLLISTIISMMPAGFDPFEWYLGLFERFIYLPIVTLIGG